MRSAEQALDALAALPCGARLLDVLRRRPEAWLVGGAVRDLLLGRTPRELDVAVEGDVDVVAAELGGDGRRHERFGTAVLQVDGCAVDLARTRTETYAAPGALPDVTPAPLQDDLLRRDFTLNAIALRPDAGVRAAPYALEDLEAGRLRVLHDRSFLDDPTRLWRLVRYAVRLGFLPEAQTDRLAREAVAAGATATVSGPRIGAEVRLALREARPLDTLHAATQLGLVEGLELDPARASAALALLAPEGRADLTLLGAVGFDVAGLGFTAAEERTLRRCAALRVPPDGPPSVIAAALRGEPVEAVAVAAARDGAQRSARWWLAEGRHVALEITGDDLRAAGIAPGPELGARLRRALDAKLDGALDGEGREAELRVALGA
ncbi:MAG TPA: hypothetical protein VD931_01200 [Baekduia sp.]|nr:hypothetical protein [Baekduia sp.]